MTTLDWSNMLLGESLGNGKILYKDVFTTTGPLSAEVYQALSYFFGRNDFVFRVLGVLLVWFQASCFNILLTSVKAYKENTFVPAFVYAILSFMFFDIASLTPMQMSMPFILISIYYNLSYIITNKRNDNMLIMNGFMVGVACLFYWPAIIYLLGAELCLIFFTNTVFRRYLLLITCALIPIGFCFTYYYWQDSLSLLIFQAFKQNISTHFMSFQIKEFLIIGSLPTLLFLMSLFKFSGAKGFTSNQVQFRLIMLMMLIVAMSILVFTKDKTPAMLVFFIPPMAFFISHFFLLIKKKIILEVSFISFCGLVLLLNFGTYFKVEKLSKHLSIDALILAKNPLSDKVKNKQIMLLGDDLSYYKGAKIKSPFIDWSTSEVLLTNLNYYDNQIKVYQILKAEQPEIIIDQYEIMPYIMQNIGFVESNYSLVEKNVYQLNTK